MKFQNIVYLYDMKHRNNNSILIPVYMKQQYDPSTLATSVVTFRRVTKRLTMRQAAEQSGVCTAIIHKAETQKPISKTSFTKLCIWLEMQPGEFFKTVEK